MNKAETRGIKLTTPKNVDLLISLPFLVLRMLHAVCQCTGGKWLQMPIGTIKHPKQKALGCISASNKGSALDASASHLFAIEFVWRQRGIARSRRKREISSLGSLALSNRPTSNPLLIVHGRH